MKQDNSNGNPADAAMALKSAVRHDQVATSLFDETFAAFLGIDANGGRCLEIMSLAGRVTAGQLAEQARLTTGAVTGVVDRLERAGYARRVRDETDRRKVWIEPTELAGRIAARVFSQFADIGVLIMQYFTVEEIDAITRFIEMNTAINRERTRLLMQHMVPPEGTNEDRIVEARAFERDTQIMTRKAQSAYDAGKPISEETFEE
ncbi:MarR family winged helix-turn-helix transcriptional regulator [Pelagibacterium halotolerans]|uniref:MarR family winged helix-turn-helix transcriptional regulator n=1 Tax=Pelagibacterium halotolerans TaxID=531813 RepID=UPI00384EAF1C